MGHPHGLTGALRQNEDTEGSVRAAASSPDPGSPGAASVPSLKPYGGMEGVLGGTLHEPNLLPCPKAALLPWGSRFPHTISQLHPQPSAAAQLVPVLGSGTGPVPGSHWCNPHQATALCLSAQPDPAQGTRRLTSAPAHQAGGAGQQPWQRPHCGQLPAPPDPRLQPHTGASPTTDPPAPANRTANVGFSHAGALA